MINGYSLKDIRVRLLFEMRDGVYSNSNRLPRETELSEILGISRTQLRDVLSELEREGFITRRHGVGTVINHHVLQVKNRMDIETEFMDMIRQCGYDPGVFFVGLTEETADPYVAEKLGVAEGTEVLRFCKLCTADGKPAIYWEDVLAKALVKKEYTSEDLRLTIFEFLKKVCGVEAYTDLTEIHAVAADEKLAEVLRVPVGTALLNMEEVDYDIEGNRVFYSAEYFVDGLIQHTVLRKKL